ncbi:MAG: alpha/beta hydrolase [Anaerolineales bacterium]|nr:alpha/beta hydrolase [Anaerolineales bacterium]MCW5854877.1 alpha/beta hydrolase [Anaerolineales bacterium]
MPTSASPIPHRVPQWWATALVGLPVAVLLLLVLAAFVPIPLLSIIAAGLSARIVQVALFAMVLVGLALWLLRIAHSRGRRVIAAAALLALAGIAVIAGRQLALAAREGVTVDLFATLAPPTPDITPDADIDYLLFDGEPVALSVWRPVGSAGPAPVIVIVHGGGWSEGSRLDAAPPTHARWFADHGYLVISVDYSLSTPTRHLWDVQEAQIGCALVWAAANASDYGGDIEWLGLIGDSAGGNLVLNVAARTAAGTLTPACPGDLPRIGATSTLYPAADPHALYANPDPVMGSVARLYLENYTGGSPAEYPDRYAAIDPATHITPAAPPALITLGEKDHLVPPGPTLAFAATLHSLGVEVKTIEIPHGEHVFDLEGGIGTQVWRAATLAWFRAHGL